MKISAGDHIKHTPGSDLAAGDVVAFANMIGIAETAIKAGEAGNLAISGLFVLEMVNDPRNPALAAGSIVYWSTEWDRVVYGSTVVGPAGVFPIGHSIETSGLSDQTIKVLLKK